MITPWYKEPWTWFVFFIPVLTIVVCFFKIMFANTHGFHMVADDYYSQGKAINQELSRQKLAAELGISLLTSINNEKITIEFEGDRPENNTTLKIGFFHSTLPDRDVEIMLPINGKGVFTQTHDVDLTGKWLVTIQPFSGEWKVKQTISLPRADTIRFEP